MKKEILHQTYMSRCLYLAKLGVSVTAPNPMVGAVIVHNDTIIGEGFHKHYGGPHAEPNAIHSVKDKSLLKESTLYVNLEPCSHFGKTPPCANLIVQMGIPKVVIATLDPNPKVSGRGVEILRKAGINVEVGILESEARELNRRFFCHIEKKRPYITLKWAQTADGFLDASRKDNSVPALKISNELTQQLTHKMRAENMAIMVGTGTVLLDNPSLTLRYWSGNTPVRVALDRNDVVSGDFKIKDGKQPAIIFTEKEKENKANLEYIKLDFSRENLNKIMEHLYLKNIHSILVEGGSALLNSFIDIELWDEANIEISPLIIKEGIPAPVLRNADLESEKTFDGHKWSHYKARVNSL